MSTSLLRQVIRHLEGWVRESPHCLFPPGEKAVQTASRESTTVEANAASSLSDAWEKLIEEVNNCRACRLGALRTKAVPGEGAPAARLVLVGEGPGAEEDLAGRPFVGKAGQLLDKILASIGLSRAEVYITNVVKCRPPVNRQPLPDEAARCFGFLARQLRLIKPRMVCALGLAACRALIKEELPLARLRGRWYDYDGIIVLPTYHHAYLLRYPQDKRLVWEDMKKLKQLLEET